MCIKCFLLVWGEHKFTKIERNEEAEGKDSLQYSQDTYLDSIFIHKRTQHNIEIEMKQ